MGKNSSNGNGVCRSLEALSFFVQPMRVSHNFREIPHCARMRGDDADIASGPPIWGGPLDQGR